MPDFPGNSFRCSLPIPYSIRFGSRLLDLSKPKVMGILNASPDSFFADSHPGTTKELLLKAGEMLEFGASILDLGAASSRPGSIEINDAHEIERLLSFLKPLRKEFPEALISIDTFRSSVASAAIEQGADMVNDISGGQSDPRLPILLARKQVPYVVMHSRGSFTEMHLEQVYDNLVVDVIIELQNRIQAARNSGICDIIADPGFGFSKKKEQNFNLLNNLSSFQILDCPILVGISRKSMITKTLGINAADALNGTTALHMVALQKGAHILRVHDVKEAIETITLFENLCSQE